ncbi:PLP-dependent aminotransferase family protein [Alicyclobacillus acidoterrestris]|uniref:PLP-dependent aminotransferase family protein n=1 Tax=Alicyclobacillus acidoterrestris (strain ATCC 49025 / DSM 3922 / CIP 106132 / NCIMB 13137 / GD3B) TaxID=1356854 RepID=T0CU56_ALIAG|nr:PLP-dependent aminotransferase family protein [Alicyclobacillus acidoterrestris]EPZ42937.1 hypothetical protein N007_14125 [Alicyclobacillus acidoterrestris ATCC 49025]UNO50046.1 PLP-dependent aminotransferase family protein [Alicyclobacillus acidoterrestris]
MSIPQSKPQHHELFAQRTKVQAGIAAFDFSGRTVDTSDVIALNYGLPDGEFFQIPELTEAATKALQVDAARVLQYGGGSGSKRILEYLAAQKTTSWNIATDPNDILMTSGSSQGIDLIARLFLNPGDEVWFEEPSYFGAIHIFALNGATERGFPMDEEGLLVDAVEQELKNRKATAQAMPKLFYVIPNFQNPTGLTMSFARRVKLAELAASYGFYIVEDDAYGELGFDEISIPSVKAIAPEHTLYLSTFSKTIAPGLRIGYIVAPRVIIQALQKVKAEGGTSGFVQEVLANFLESVDFSAHLKKVRTAYRLRRDAMVETLAAHFPKEVTWTNPSGGFFVWVTLPPYVDVAKLWEYAIEERVSFVGGAPFYVSEGSGAQQMRLSFSFYSPNVVHDGMVRLAKSLRNYLDDTPQVRPS